MLYFAFTRPAMSLKAEIIRLEELLFQKHVRSSPDRLRELLSDDFREIGASGNCFGLDEVLADLPTGEGWSIVTRDHEFQTVTDDVVRLTYRALIRHSINDAGVHSIRSSIWKNCAGQWKMAFHQATKLPVFAAAGVRGP